MDLQVLLKAGANTEAPKYDWMTPLHNAAYGGHVNVVEVTAKKLLYALLRQMDLQVLLDAGANIDALDKLKWTPIYYAAVEVHIDVLEVTVKEALCMRRYDR